MMETEWKGEYFCPKCRKHTDKFTIPNGTVIDICWSCKMPFKIEEGIEADMRDL